MKQLIGFEKKVQNRLVCRLLKSHYGLKQALMQLNTRFDEFIKSQGFLKNVYDTFVNMKKLNHEIFNLIILLSYMNDMLILTKNQFNVDRCKY